MFELMDGRYLSQQTKVDADTKDGYDENDGDVENEQTKKPQRCRNPKLGFQENQRIRHVIGLDKEIMGVFKMETGCIEYGGNLYTLYQFAKEHKRQEKPNLQTHEVNAWAECECEVNGEWVSTYDLPIINQQGCLTFKDIP